MTGPDLLVAARRSIAQLRMHNRRPVRVRIHPLDAETIVAHYSFPKASLSRAIGEGKVALLELTSLVGLEVVLDEAARLGEPVAEWDAPADG